MLHHPDLAGRRVRPQEVALDVDVERVPQVARRVIGRDVEHLEVGQVVLDLGALVGRRTRTGRRSRRSRAIASMLGWRLPRRIGRPGVVTSTVSAARRPVSAEPRRSVPRSARARLDVAADGVGDGADARPVVGRQRPDPAQDGRQPALLAEDVDLERLERGDVAGAPRSTRGRRRAAPRGRGSGPARSTVVPLRIGAAGNHEPSSVVDVEGSVAGWLGGRAPPADQALLASSAICPKVAASRMARSARILRSISTSAFLRPAMNWP